MVYSANVQVIFQWVQMNGDSVQEYWLDSRIVPACVSAISGASLLLYLVICRLTRKHVPEATEFSIHAEPASFWDSAKLHIQSHGGGTIFMFQLLQLAACLVFLAISITDVLVGDHKLSSLIISLALLFTSAFSSLLAFLSVALSAKLNRILFPHLTLVLLTAFSVYVVRDLWPLATYNRSPLDGFEGLMLWVRLGTLFVGGVFIPLFIPRQYIPVDPTDAMPEPNLEQTASVFSAVTYTYLDRLIFLANRVPHLRVDQLPPLPDYDYSKNLRKVYFPNIDPFSGARKKHLFFGLLRSLSPVLFWQSVALVGVAVTEILSPIGMNRLLNYLEDGGAGATVRPWVWIFLIFIGPLSMELCGQWYFFLATGTLVRMEGMITQLVFEHALRIRVKAELPDRVTGSSDSDSSESIEGDPHASQIFASAAEENDGLSRESTAVSTETTDTDTETVYSVGASSESTTGKVKGKGKDSSKAQDGDGQNKDEENKNLAGRINNYVTSDLTQINNGKDFLWIVIYAPLEIVLDVIFLYIILGPSSIVGLIVMILLIPVPAQFTKLFHGLQKEKMKATDSRVQTVTEVLNILRMVKLFAWEDRVARQIGEKRELELRQIWKRRITMVAMDIVNRVIPLIHMIVTYAFYTLVMKKELTVAVVFSSLTVFELLRDQFFNFMYTIPPMIQAKVSLDRVNDFLTKTELLDLYAEKTAEEVSISLNTAEVEHRGEIGFKDASFSWSNSEDGTLTPSKQQFRLRIEKELVFQKGAINLIVGPTGSGKTSLLMALLGEMHYIPTAPGAWFNLPRADGIAYAAQESWVQNETIRENILFGAPYDEERYKKVIHQCGLERDIALFDAGDRTEVGEKGLTLSGGQKARVTLARAVYSSADILLLDDVLAALDVHTSRWIVDKCFQGSLIRGRTVLLVTHNVALASPIASFVVTLGTDGRIKSHGSVQDAIARDSTFRKEMAEEQVALKKAEQIDGDAAQEPPKAAEEDKGASGKLIVEEEVALGHLSWSSLKLFLAEMGGRWPILFWLTLVGGLLGSELAVTGQVWWLGQWAQAYTGRDAADVSIFFYLGIYIMVMLAGVMLFALGMFENARGSVRASRRVHEQLVGSVLGSTLGWLDRTPTSRIIMRCTQDIEAVDSRVTMNFVYLLDGTGILLIKFLAVVFYTPIFAIPGAVVGLAAGWAGRAYKRAQLPIKREMSNAKSPVLGHFGAAITGLTSIRAYGAEVAFKKESLRRIDLYSRTARAFYSVNRWINVRITILGCLFSAGLAAYMVYVAHGDAPANVGFSINMAVAFTMMVLWWVRLFNELEVEGNSLERVKQYLEIEQEPKATKQGVPPASWPTSGELVVEKLSARYSVDGPKVLHDLSFRIKSGERIGVVGRTGSGKSSLTLSLLRCILTEGEVYYDGVPTSSLNLDALRSHMTIIPQVPELLSGTLRHNLDPFDQCDDATLNDVLRTSGLNSIQNDSEDGRLTLNSAISSGGSNLSVGQRQIIALARAMLRQSKILILDEATSSIDYKTDTIIQNSLRDEFKDVTLITIAHRLQTIMDADKIMVLDAGRMVEYDSPAELLKNKNGLLRALVDESSDKDSLISMAATKGTEK